MDRVPHEIEPRHVELWGQHTVKLPHTLADREMFSDESIAALIDTVDAEHIKIETMPDDGYDVRAWSSCDRTGLTGMQVLEAVRNGRIWIELKALEEIDPRFADVLTSLYGELEAELRFNTFRRKLNLLVSSPSARVFYHFDVPGQTLVQLRGRKRIWIYPPTAPFPRPENVENTVRSVSTEGLDYQEWFDDYAEVLNYGNGILRSVGRWRPRSRATSGAAFWTKAAMTAAWRASGMQREQSYRWVPGHRIDPDAPHCVRPIERPEPAAQAQG